MEYELGGISRRSIQRTEAIVIVDGSGTISLKEPPRVGPHYLWGIKLNNLVTESHRMK